jgi:Tfp pilus assembly protein PilF
MIAICRYGLLPVGVSQIGSRRRFQEFAKFMPKTRALVACLLTFSFAGCSSHDSVAAGAAAEAELDLRQGRDAAASQAIHIALAARDDVSEYWITLAKIDLATNDVQGAFSAYENAIGLDRANVEVLRALCQLGIAAGAPDKVDKYADQLLLINPEDTTPVIAKGQAALARGDATAALQFAEQVLKKAPQDNGAQILKARILAGRGEYAQAAQFIEDTLGTGGDDSSRLIYLKGLYREAHDRAHYELTLKRLAEGHPADAAIQLDYADMLYQTGMSGAANGVIVQITRKHPHDIGVAEDVLQTWLTQGPDALGLAQISSQAGVASLEIKAIYAQFANELGHPELAKSILHAALQNKAISTESSDAEAALAYADGLMGHRTTAIARLSEILQFDQFQPRALLARSRLRMADKDVSGAIEDARSAVAEDPKNASARLALADALFAQGDATLGENALREGARAMPDDVRIAARLANYLVTRGQRDLANEVLRNLMRASPVSLRALRLRQAFDPTAKPAAMLTTPQP